MGIILQLKLLRNYLFLALLIFCTMFSYCRGYENCKKNYTIKLLQEVQHRYEAGQEEYQKTEKAKEKIFIDRGKRNSDKRDSCLMSNDPFSVKCF